ncbi:glycosyltransferase family 2 protein [Caldiplasma sukawensis]
MDVTFSVIITAHDRRKYVRDAFKSVIEQTRKDLIKEIIVVKNYEDESIDKYILENGGKTLIEKDRKFGAKLSVGMENSNGDYICFLDDDDLFAPDKIELLNNFIAKNHYPLYIHNKMVFIFENTSLNDYTTHKRTGEYSVFSSENIRLNPSIIGKNKIDWYCSCITIKRSEYIKWTYFLRNSGRSLDKILFLIAINEKNSNIMSIEDKLTLYRKHESVTGIYENVKNFRSKRLNFLTESELALIEFYNNSNKANVEKIMNYVLCKIRSNIAIFQRERKKNFQKTFICTLKIGITYREIDSIVLSVLLIIHLIAPEISAIIYRFLQLNTT